MAYENLLKSVEESAEERERELQESAERAILDIKAGASRKAELIRSMLHDDASRSAIIERNKQLYLTSAETKKNLITTKEKIYLTAFVDAQKRLTQLRSDTKYPDTFKKLALEAIREIGVEKFELHIDERDKKLCQDTLEGLNLSCKIVPDLKTLGGVSVGSADGSIIISNTVESRLERAKERLKLEVYSAIFGG